MDLESKLTEALDAAPEVSALACIDANRGEVLAVALRHDFSKESFDGVANCAGDLCSRPKSAPPRDDGSRLVDELFVIGGRWIHTIVAARSAPGLLVVGAAPATGNLSLLLSCTRAVARDIRGREGDVGQGT